MGFNGVILRSTNSGINWSQIPSGTNSNLRSVAFAGTGTGYVCGYNGAILKTVNSGMNWISLTSNTSNDLFAVIFINNSTGYSAGSGKIIKTTNGGNNWISQQILFTGDFYDIMFSNINTGWAAGQFGTINSTINGGVGVKLISSEIPESFALHQNFPNPFNPVTKINYELPASRGERVTNYVSLTVFDILGNEIKSLVNAKQTAGSYEVDFDGKGLSSGIYFYKLSAGSFSETKMMTLIK
ncbi:MAG: T9SS type A sorting domain-containing protein [Ignavibacteria bacterium]|nr:T9SS type A sorting domain-containing protein [Ignavibacteria bacterium]